MDFRIAHAQNFRNQLVDSCFGFLLAGIDTVGDRQVVEMLEMHFAAAAAAAATAWHVLVV